MTRYVKMMEREDGWSDWVQPRENGYRLMCCDCGLVHELQFGVVNATAGAATVMVDEKAGMSGVVIFRARRNDRATAARRRRGKKR